MRIGFLISLLILFAVAIKAGAANESDKNQNSDNKKADCSSFDVKGRNSAAPTRKLTPVDSTIIPLDFPPAPGSSQACGCHKFVKTAYYLSELNKEVIFAYYRKALNDANFFVGEVTEGEAPSLYIMQFAGDKAVGEIYFFEDKGGFGIKYVPKKPCNCPEKDKTKTGENNN